MNFIDTTNIVTGTSALITRGSCASISDTLGNLLFYAGYNKDVYINGGPAFKNGEVFNGTHQTMVNGDSIVMQLWYHEVVIIDYPSQHNIYYVFSIGVTQSSQQGLYYSIVDMSANGGNGAVIQKNVQLQNFKMVDCLTSIKHGNGRDWWVIFRKFVSASSPNNDYYFYLVTPSGISTVFIQSFGSLNSTNLGHISFNAQGNQMAFINYKGLIELYDFDRCTGTLSNAVTIQQESPAYPWPGLWSAEFSPSGHILYVTRIPEVVTDSSRLFQYDLQSGNIAASKDTLWSAPFMITIDQLKRAPDNKNLYCHELLPGIPLSGYSI